MGVKTSIGPNRIDQYSFDDLALARNITEAVLVPGNVITADISAAWVYVGNDCLLRIQVSADTYIAFASDTAGTGVSTGASAVSSTSTPALKLAAGYYLIRATADFIKASANPTRIEQRIE